MRINPIDSPFYDEDIKEVVSAIPHAIRLPKTNHAKDVIKLEKDITKWEKEFGIPVGTIKIHPMIETALGVEHSFEIAISSNRVNAITIGGQDLTADMGVKKTLTGEELLYARQRIVMAAKAAGIDALDTVFADVNDEEGLIRETKLIKMLGYSGKAVINPRQIKPVHNVFMPTEDEIIWAQEVINAFYQAKKKGKGVVSLRGKMIDPPVVKRAERILKIIELIKGAKNEK